jgi:hypothetical protein
VTIGGNGIFSGYLKGAGLMMMRGREMAPGGQVIVVGRLFVIGNGLVIFMERAIDPEYS